MPGGAAWRAGSEPTYHQDREKEALGCRSKGLGILDCQGWKGDKAKVTCLSKWRYPDQSYRVRWKGPGGRKRLEVSPESHHWGRAGDLGHKKFLEMSQNQSCAKGSTLFKGVLSLLQCSVGGSLSKREHF